MKYLATTFAIACMAFGFAATPAQANESWECAENGGQWVAIDGENDTCIYPDRAEIDGVEPLTDTADKGNPDGRHIYSNPKTEDSESEVAGREYCQGKKRWTRHCRILLDRFADREDGRDGDVGGGDFGGEADRAAASTSAE